MVNRRSIISKILRGNLRTAIFAVTSACNCKCSMCDMYKQEPKFIDYDDAKRILDFLNNNKFLVSYFTGGEPTLHPYIAEIVGYANDLGLVTSLTTNGAVDRRKLEDLKDAGLYMLSVSSDHYEPSVCEEIRGFKGIFDRAMGTISHAKELGMNVYALAYLNQWLLESNGDLEKLVKFANKELGVPFAFCYPTQTATANTTYKLGGTERIGDVQKETMAMKRILTLQKNGATVLNPMSYVEGAIRFNEGKKVEYVCKGGEDVCYIDWYGDFYPCFIKEKLFNVLRDEPKGLRNASCNECLINCFREPSILPQMFSFKHGLKEIVNKIVYKTSLSAYF